MKRILIFLLFFVVGLQAQTRIDKLRLDSLKIDNKIFIKGTDRTDFFDNLNAGNYLKPEGLLYKGAYKNKGQMYPIVGPDSAYHQLLFDALLDIKIIGAVEGCHYRLQYLVEDNATYGDCIVVNEWDNATNTKIRDILPLENISYNVDYDTINTITTTNDESDNEVMVVITIDYSAYDTWFNCLSSGNTYYNNKISEDCYIYTDGGTIQNNSVPLSKLSAKGATRNKGIKYPIVGPETASSTFVEDGILDIKIINAVQGRLYRISYIADNNATFDDMIWIDEVDKDTFTETRRLFNHSQAVSYDITDRDSISTLLLSSTTGIDVILTIDYGQIADGSGWRSYVVGDDFLEDYISEDNYIYSTDNTRGVQNPVVQLAKYTAADSVLRVAFKWSDAYDFWIDFGPNLANTLYTFKEFNKAANNLSYVSGDFSVTPTEVEEVNSDWIGPIMADSGKYGNPSGFVGGNHTKSGHPTARMTSFSLYADGKPLPADTLISCERIDVLTTERIMGYNTIDDVTGEGTDIIEQTILYTVQENTIEVNVKIEWIEDATCAKYYGLQATYADWDSIHFVNGQQSGLALFSSVPNSGVMSSYDVDRFVLFDNDTDVRMSGWVDSTYGIGDHSLIADTYYAFFVSGTKTYAFLEMGDVDIDVGEVWRWRGGYVFTPGLTGNNSSFSFVRKNAGDTELIIDMVDADTVSIAIPLNYRNKSIEAKYEDADLSIDSFVGPEGVNVEATNYGSSEFTLKD